MSFSRLLKTLTFENTYILDNFKDLPRELINFSIRRMIPYVTSKDPYPSPQTLKKDYLHPTVKELSPKCTLHPMILLQLTIKHKFLHTM